MAGLSPKKRGPPPVIPDTFMNAIATHSQVCQVGDGESKSMQIKRLIDASILGMQYEDRFKVDSVWKKLKTHQHPEVLQAAPKMTVEDARAQFSTYNNLNQWFDDVQSTWLQLKWWWMRSNWTKMVSC